MLFMYYAIKTSWILTLTFYPEKMYGVSDDQDEPFHREVIETESRYKGKSSPALLADYFLALVHELKSSNF